jgi:hypothetical protein
LPLTFVAGVDGFDLFAPYLACAVALTHMLWAIRRRRIAQAAMVPVTVR